MGGNKSGLTETRSKSQDGTAQYQIGLYKGLKSMNLDFGFSEIIRPSRSYADEVRRSDTDASTQYSVRHTGVSSHQSEFGAALPRSRKSQN